MLAQTLLQGNRVVTHGILDRPGGALVAHEGEVGAGAQLEHLDHEVRVDAGNRNGAQLAGVALGRGSRG
jgi:hypothetical protein